MSHFELKKTPIGSMNFSIVNDEGITLSFAADDSAGAFKDEYIRTYLVRFGPENNQRLDEEEQYAITPEQYLEALAKHLGYSVARKYPTKEQQDRWNSLDWFEATS